jgi:hypothetical protein
MKMKTGFSLQSTVGLVAYKLDGDDQLLHTSFVSLVIYCSFERSRKSRTQSV